MSYRKIQVEGKTYQYVIGGSNIHIKGVGDFPTKDHGNPVAYPGYDGKPVLRQGMFVATPKTVRALILGETTPVRVKNGQTLLMINPFQAEVYDRIEYLPYDAQTYYNLKDDI